MNGVVSKLYHSLNRNGHLLLGNIKQIGPQGGLFRSHTSAQEINNLFRHLGGFAVVQNLDRGNDILLLMRKQEHD